MHRRSPPWSPPGAAPARPGPRGAADRTLGIDGAAPADQPPSNSAWIGRVRARASSSSNERRAFRRAQALLRAGGTGGLRSSPGRVTRRDRVTVALSAAHDEDDGKRSSNITGVYRRPRPDIDDDLTTSRWLWGLRSDGTPTPQDSPATAFWTTVAIDLIGFGIVLPILPLYAERYGASPGWRRRSSPPSPSRSSAAPCGAPVRSSRLQAGS
jgi:hypothetical protein